MADYPNEYEQADQREFADEQRELAEEQMDAWDESAGNYPSAKKDRSLFSLFNDVWKAPDSTKVGNLDPKTELGDLGLSVRQCKKISHAAFLLNESDVAGWFDNLSETTLSTSMSKKGWFTELFVSTKKFAHKDSIQNLGQHAGSEKKSGWRLFGRKKETTTAEQ